MEKEEDIRMKEEVIDNEFVDNEGPAKKKKKRNKKKKATTDTDNADNKDDTQKIEIEQTNVEENTDKVENIQDETAIPDGEKKKKKKRNKKKKVEKDSDDEAEMKLEESNKYPLPYKLTGKHIKKTRLQNNSHIINLGSWKEDSNFKQTMPPTKTI